MANGSFEDHVTLVMFGGFRRAHAVFRKLAWANNWTANYATAVWDEYRKRSRPPEAPGAPPRPPGDDLDDDIPF